MHMRALIFVIFGTVTWTVPASAAATFEYKGTVTSGFDYDLFFVGQFDAQPADLTGATFDIVVSVNGYTPTNDGGTTPAPPGLSGGQAMITLNFNAQTEQLVGSNWVSGVAPFNTDLSQSGGAITSFNHNFDVDTTNIDVVEDVSLSGTSQAWTFSLGSGHFVASLLDPGAAPTGELNLFNGLDDLQVSYNYFSATLPVFTTGGGAPEPAAWVTLLFGFMTLGMMVRRRALNPVAL